MLSTDFMDLLVYELIGLLLKADPPLQVGDMSNDTRSGWLSLYEFEPKTCFFSMPRPHGGFAPSLSYKLTLT